MESGLEDRNNVTHARHHRNGHHLVSMKSGLEGRNNSRPHSAAPHSRVRLNEVRPRRPEQWAPERPPNRKGTRLNEVRPRRPEQCSGREAEGEHRCVSMKSGLEGRNNTCKDINPPFPLAVSMKSGLEGRNNLLRAELTAHAAMTVSMKSGLEGRNNQWSHFASGRRNRCVSMKSGLEGRNNAIGQAGKPMAASVSMKSGLEGRNNRVSPSRT